MTPTAASWALSACGSRRGRLCLIGLLVATFQPAASFGNGRRGRRVAVLVCGSGNHRYEDAQRSAYSCSGRLVGPRRWTPIFAIVIAVAIVTGDSTHPGSARDRAMSGLLNLK